MASFAWGAAHSSARDRYHTHYTYLASIAVGLLGRKSDVVLGFLLSGAAPLVALSCVPLIALFFRLRLVDWLSRSYLYILLGSGLP